MEKLLVQGALGSPGFPQHSLLQTGHQPARQRYVLRISAGIQIPQHVLDTALKVVEAKIDRFDLIKTGEIEPERCGRCDYCKRTKVLTVPSVYESEE